MFSHQADTEEELEHVGVYLVSAADPPIEVAPYPDLVTDKLGQTREGKAMQFKPISHKAPYFAAPINEELEMSFSVAKDLEYSFDFDLQKPDEKV